MKDTGLYQYLLVLESPWSVTRVELNTKDQQVDVFTDHEKDAVWVCPKCSKGSPLHDHAEERIWRHLDSCQYKTYMHSRIANVLTYIRHRITNAVSEGLNSKIQTIKKMAYGFRNKEHFKTAIYFHCGGLDLYPC